MRELVFRPATASDSARLLEWRNDPLTRGNSVSTSEVLPGEHQAWLEGALQNSARKLWIAEVAGRPVGVVRLDYQDQECELSWTVAPEARGQGWGKLMVAEAAALAGCPVWARIRKDNLASQRIAQYAGLSAVAEEGDLTMWRACGC